MAHADYDMESMLKAKAFSQLDDSEKAFVLQHVDNEAEYERIRRMINMIAEAPGPAFAGGDDPSFRDHLIAIAEERAATLHGGRIPLYRRTWVVWTVTGIAATFLVAVFWLFRGSEDTIPAEQLARIEEADTEEKGADGRDMAGSREDNTPVISESSLTAVNDGLTTSASESPEMSVSGEKDTELTPAAPVTLHAEKAGKGVTAYHWNADTSVDYDITVDQAGSYTSMYGNAAIAPQQIMTDSLTVVTYTSGNLAMIQQTPPANPS